MPTYTVHDLTHADALWETASLVTGPDVELNPAEGFVLGAAFLFHDAAMGLAAYRTAPLRTLVRTAGVTSSARPSATEWVDGRWIGRWTSHRRTS
jgi:hypothetical protein